MRLGLACSLYRLRPWPHLIGLASRSYASGAAEAGKLYCLSYAPSGDADPFRSHNLIPAAQIEEDLACWPADRLRADLTQPTRLEQSQGLLPSSD